MTTLVCALRYSMGLSARYLQYVLAQASAIPLWVAELGLLGTELDVDRGLVGQRGYRLGFAPGRGEEGGGDCKVSV